MQWSTEQEYVYALLIQQLNMGSLSPAEIDWASAQMRAWGRKLEFEAVPRSSEGFYVDLASKRGLVRRTGNESGPTLRFLDTTPLADQLERAMHAIRQTDIGEPGAAAAVNLQRIAILEKVRPVVAPNLHGDLRRSPRMPVTVAAKVRVGPRAHLRRAHAARDASSPRTTPTPATSRSRCSRSPTARAPGATTFPTSTIRWRRRSCRSAIRPGRSRTAASPDCASPRRAASARASCWARSSRFAKPTPSIGCWAPCAGSNKVSNDEVEAGVSIIADRIVPITVNARRAAKEDLGMVVNGVDVSTMGSRFEALYLPPPSRPEKPLTVKTLIVPTSEYADGRNLILTTGHSVYTIALRHLVEQRADWSWAAFQIIDKKPTDY